MAAIAINIGRHPRQTAFFDELHPFLDPPEGDAINGEDSGQCAPFGGHIGDGQAVVKGQGRYTLACELHGVVEDLVLVEVPAEGDDNVFTADTRFEFTIEATARYRGDLPPSAAGGPDRSGVGTDNRRSQATQAAVHVAVAVGGHDDRLRPGVTFLAHDLVTYPAPGGVVVDAVLAREGGDFEILGQVGLALVLDIVIEREHDLSRVGDFGGADTQELGYDRAGIVMGHDVGGADRQVITAVNGLSFIEPDGEALGNFLDQVLTCCCLCHYLLPQVSKSISRGRHRYEIGRRL